MNGIVSFPFAQIGAVLRALSLSGSVGNVAAILIYGVICLSPVVVRFVLIKKGIRCQADDMLYLISGGLFVYLYYMVNPGLFVVPIPKSGNIYLAGAFYSILFTYFVLRILEKSKEMNRDGILHVIPKLLYALGVIFAIAVVLELFVNLPAALKAVGGDRDMMGNTVSVMGVGSMESANLFTTYLFLGLGSVVTVFPYVLDIFVVLTGVGVLKAWEEDWYSERAVSQTEKLASICRKCLCSVVLVGMSFNILQLIFRNSLYSVKMMVSLPVDSLVFILLMLLAARYMRESQRLKEDNELFI